MELGVTLDSGYAAAAVPLSSIRPCHPRNLAQLPLRPIPIP